MKKLIRKSVFETNSSSAHSLVFTTNSPENTVYDTIFPNCNGDVIIDCSIYDFSKYNNRASNDVEEKAAFFAILWDVHHREDLANLELLKNVIKSNSHATRVIFINTNNDDFDFVSDFELPSTFDELYRIIFDKNCWLILKSDTIDIYKNESLAEKYNLPIFSKQEKRLVRTSVFETNSSSAHSLAFATDINGAVYDTVYPDEDGCVVIPCDDYYFARQEPRITNDTIEKIAFFASVWGEGHYNSEDKMELLESVIKSNSKATEVLFLGLEQTVIEFYDDFDLPQDFDDLYRVIFDKNCYLRLMGDEYYFDSKEDEELFDNPPIVTK